MSDSCAFGFGAAAVNTLGFYSLSVGEIWSVLYDDGHCRCLRERIET